MRRFETEALTNKANLAALADLSGKWIDAIHGRRPTNVVVLGPVGRPPKHVQRFYASFSYQAKS